MSDFLSKMKIGESALFSEKTKILEFHGAKKIWWRIIKGENFSHSKFFFFFVKFY